MTMEMGRQQRLQDDYMNGNWSFGRNYNPFSQTRKMSIGLVVNSSVKMKSTNGKGVVSGLKTLQTVTSVKDIPAESKHKGKEGMAPCQESTPLVCKRAFNQNMSYSDANGRPNIVSSFPSNNNVPFQPSGNKIVGENRPATEKESNGNAYQTEKESSYATPQNGLEPKKGITEHGTSERGNNGPVILRMKVQELLQTVCSPDMNEDNNETFEMDANNVKKQQSTTNTRETNSGNVENKIMRPLTRSLTRNKPQAKKSVPKNQASYYQSEQAQRDEKAFSFLESWSKRQTPDVNHGSKISKRKEREISVNRPVKTRVVETVQKDERKTKAAGSNVSSFGTRTRDSEIVKPTIKTKHQPEGNNVNQSSFAKRSSMNNVDPQYDFKNPTFEAAKISSPVSLFHINMKNLDVDSPSERSFKTKRSSSFHSKGSLKEGLYNANTKNVVTDLEDSPFIEPNRDENNHSKSPSKVVQSETSFKIKRSSSFHSKGSSKRGHYNANTKNVAMDLEDSSFIEPNLKEYNRSKSSSKMVECESSDDDSPISEPFIMKNQEANKWSISPCQEEYSESSEDDSPIKVTEDGDCDKFDDSPEQDGFAGAVKLFAVALERIQSKIHSTTSRQSAAILLSVSKNIHSQLQNAESKIQNEVGKLTNLGNSKKMHPENQCKEQQEQLKHIYEKFKEDVDQHLEKCRSTLEGLESHQIQVRGMAEKQRLLHKKFLLQTEEAIEKQLNDAQTRLTDVHRLARNQTHKLKFSISECLNEGLLS